VKKRVAVIGAGVAGVSAAYHLRDDADLALFDKSDYVGGHANTIEVTEGDRTIGIDTAFVVFNGRTYPQLSGFFEELDVPVLDHQGGFNFFDLDSGLQYGTSEFELGEDEIAARYPPEFLQVWADAKRFYEQTPKDFLRKRTDMSLGEYLDRNGYSEAFKTSYVILLATAVWSVPPELIWEMPATTFVAFFMAHDPGGLGGQSVAWKTVGGGSINYVRRALKAIGGRVELETEVRQVAEDETGVTVTTPGGTERFDYAVVAAHADEALALLEEPGPAGAYLEKVHYNLAQAVLHTDPSVLPEDRSRWQSWNYGRVEHDGAVKAYVAYYMNRLHGFDAEQDYFVTLDYPLEVREDSIIRRLPYMHPIIDLPVRDMQTSIYEINGTDSRIKFCGSYFHAKKIGRDLVGSHEAAFCSGVEAAKAIQNQLDRASTPVQA
jgi:predicted NAD/FAD-binding protein